MTFDFSQIEFKDISGNRLAAIPVEQGQSATPINQIVGLALWRTAPNPLIHQAGTAFYRNEPLEVSEKDLSELKLAISQKGFAYFIQGPIIDYINSLA